MLTNRIVAAAFGAAALFGTAMGVAPASAAPVSAAPALASGVDTGLVQEAQYRRRPHFRQRCFVQHRRVWTPRGWVVRPVRVCR